MNASVMKIPIDFGELLTFHSWKSKKFTFFLLSLIFRGVINVSSDQWRALADALPQGRVTLRLVPVIGIFFFWNRSLDFFDPGNGAKCQNGNEHVIRT